MVVGEASIHNIMGGMESTGGVRLHNHKRKLKQRFDIIKKLGQGTYGKVQLGINKETGQEVAIKTIKKCKIETEADLIRIRREIQIMSSVQHPNIIHIYEVFENKEKMVLVMEYAAGGELYDYLSERKVLSEPEARRIFRQISIAVFYCHKHKICHRDLKLENILLDQVGNAKIADFGLSNVFDEQRLLNTFCGSPLYASPEIVKGTPYHGPEVDCWSLGVLLYTLVYGAMPFDGSNFKRLTRQISQSDYFEPRTPSPASPLIKDMLTKCPSRRSDIEKICSHWWVNDGYEQNCLDIAEDLAAQTPVRLDLLLSLVPQSASAEKLVVGDQRASGEVTNNMSSDTLAPTRCHSVGSLMEIDRNNSDRRVREMVEDETRTTVSGDSKRKLETTPSMEETPSLETGAKRKERSRKKDKSEDSGPRAHRFTSNRHHSAPIAHPITEESMEIDQAINEKVSTKPQLDLRNDETATACLELIKESLSKSPSKERSRTPVAPEQSSIVPEKTSRDVNENVNDEKPISDKLAGVNDKILEPVIPTVVDESSKLPESIKEPSTKVESIDESKIDVTPLETTKNNETLDKTKLENNDVISKPLEIEKIMETSVRDTKKLKQKALSLDCDVSNEVAAPPPVKPVERRRSKIFETAEKFNQLAAGVENEKPKKIFIPGVNVGGAKKVFERRASLSGTVVPTIVKQSASKVIIDVPGERKNEKIDEKSNVATTTTNVDVKNDDVKRDEEKKRAIDIISGAIGKPPVQKKLNGSPPITPQSPDHKKLALKIPLGPNDLRSATISVTTPVDTKFPFENKPVAYEKSVSNTPESRSLDNSYVDEPTVSSKMEITLKSATLPRPRKTSKAEITLSGIKSPEVGAFKSEVEAKIDAFIPQKLRTQRSEVAFPVAAVVHQTNRSSSLEPEGIAKILPKERIIPIQVDPGHQQQSQRQTSTPPPKPPMPQRSMSQRSNSLSRQSTVDSDTDSALGSTVGPEPIRKSPREYIIPIAVEGGGYVTPRSGSVEPESKSGSATGSNTPRSRFGRPRRMSSLLSDASEDESPFSTLHRDSDDLLQRHMHRLRSSRPTRQPPEHADSLSSGEDDDDDGFELLTAENLFSTLLSRVRSLTQRLNVDDNRGSGFPSSRLLGRMGSNSSQGFWGLHEPLSRRLADSPFRRPMSREMDRFGKRDSAMASNSGTPSSPGARSTPSRESIFEMGSSNTLPRDKKIRSDHKKSDEQTTTIIDKLKINKEDRETLDQSFTPSLARRLSRQFIEQTRQSLPRSPSIPREKLYRSSTTTTAAGGGTGLDNDEQMKNRRSSTTISDQTEYRSRSCDRGVRRANSLLENNDRRDRFDHRSPRRSVSLFDDDDDDDKDDDRTLPPLPRQVMTLGRKYRDPGKSVSSSIGLRRDSFHNYRTEKIQEETVDEFANSGKNGICESVMIGGDDCSTSNSTSNVVDEGSGFSVRSCETSPTESSSTIGDYTLSSSCKNENSREFENRMLAAENLIKASKLRNFSTGKFDRNLATSYRDTDKCGKELSGSITDVEENLGKRRSCIPSLRLRSGSLTRESAMIGDRRKTVSCSQDAIVNSRVGTPERSLLSKFFRAGSNSSSSTGSCVANGRSENLEIGEKSEKIKGPRRISRFLRPDFFDTPREESQYVKDKEARKAADNERRKSRFTKKKNETKILQEREIDDDDSSIVEKPEKELKNEANAITRDKNDGSLPRQKIVANDQVEETKIEKLPTTKNSFLQTLEKKFEKFRSNDDGGKLTNGNFVGLDDKVGKTRENSAPPEEIGESREESAKRSTSVEDLVIGEKSVATTIGTSKSRVSSVLGLFKNDSSKTNANGQRTQNTILSKFKRNPYRGSRSDGILDTDQTQAASTSSKIPTKFVKIETTKSLKKSVDVKKSAEKLLTETKKSPTKEIGPLEKSTTKKSVAIEKPTKIVKKSSPEKSFDVKMEKSCLIRKDSDPGRKTASPEKICESKIVGSRLAMAKKLSPEKTTDNKQTESRNVETDDKMAIRTKKIVKSVTNLTKNGSVSKIEKVEDGGEKKVKKLGKTTKETNDKDIVDATKKKKIVRVVKKVVKKSDSSDSKSDDKEKTTKTIIKKITCKKDSSPETSGKSKDKSPDCVVKIKDKSPDCVVKIKDKSPDCVVKIKDKSPDCVVRIKDKSPERKIKDKSPDCVVKIKDKSPDCVVRIKDKSPERKIKDKSPDCVVKIKDKSPDCLVKIKDKSPECKIKDKSLETLNTSGDKTTFDDKISSITSGEKIVNSAASNCVGVIDDTSATSSQIGKRNFKVDATPTNTEILIDSTKIAGTTDGESKIKATTFNNLENIDSDCHDQTTTIGSAKSMRNNLKLDLSKIPQHSFKPPTTSRKEFTTLESTNLKVNPNVRRIATSESPKSEANKMDDPKSQNGTSPKTFIDVSSSFKNSEDRQRQLQTTDSRMTKNFNSPNSVVDGPTKNSCVSRASKDSTMDQTEDAFSPMDDNESFDSWSICSADLNHRRDIQSPTSPSYSPSIRGDHSESIIDRIRRKSFYSRFNERKRKTSLNAPPPGIALPGCSNLSRKYSFNSTRDKDRDKGIGSGFDSRRHHERSYSLYNDDSGGYGKSTIDRDRYYDVTSHGGSSTDLKSSTDRYGSLGSCYESTRRYGISPSPESFVTSKNYRSTDYGLDNDPIVYKTRLSPSSINDNGLDLYSGRSTLPRKYGSTSSFPETKTADYYEELLTPTRSDYLGSVKISMGDFGNKRENGYHNGDGEILEEEGDKWKTYSDGIAGLDLTDGSDETIVKQMRSSVGKNIETRDPPASSSEPDIAKSKAE